MRTKALYFPYINLPNDDWLYLMLLYWDKLSSILPSAYIYNPEDLSPHMPILLSEGLVTPIYPQDVLHDVPNFGKPFLDFIRHRLKKGYFHGVLPEECVPIHIEKLGGIADELVELRLAKQAEYPWYKMHPWVANVFMSYLASVLGSLPDIDSAPVTNDPACFHLLAGYQQRVYPERIRLRQMTLREIFPFPRGQLDLTAVVRFKEKYGEQLCRFRNKIESLCIELSNVPLPDREEQRKLKTAELKDEIDFLADRMRRTWHQITFLDLFPVLSSSGAVAAQINSNQPVAAGLGALSLFGAVYRCVTESQKERLLRHPLAYGALLTRELAR